MQRRLASIATHPELADVYRLLGRKDPTGDELYKVYELLSKLWAENRSSRSGPASPASASSSSRTTATTPELTGDDARHAVPTKNSRGSEQITLAEAERSSIS